MSQVNMSMNNMIYVESGGIRSRANAITLEALPLKGADWSRHCIPPSAHILTKQISTMTKAA